MYAGPYLPVRIDPALASRVVVIAQIVMLGYCYSDAEAAIDAVYVNGELTANILLYCILTFIEPQGGAHILDP